MVASLRVCSRASQADIIGYTTIIAAVCVLLITHVGCCTVRSAEFGLASAVKRLVVDKASDQAAKAGIVDALALG